MRRHYKDFDDDGEQDWFEDEMDNKEHDDRVEIITGGYSFAGDDDCGEIAGSWSNWTPARTQAALAEALKLREDSNAAFRAGDYRLNTKIYSDASYDVLYLKGVRELGGIPKSDGVRTDDYGDAI